MADTVVILNAGAGTIQDRKPDTVRQSVETAFGSEGHSVEVVLAEGPEFIAAIERAAVSGPPRVVVGGGDGSVGCAVASLAGKDRTLGVLPLGTMNLFARSLGMPTDLDLALKALATAKPKRIDLARVNGRIFHTLAGLGFFAQVARARAEVRSDGFGRFVAVIRSTMRAFVRTNSFDLSIDADGQQREIEAYAVFISNNRLSATGFDRPRLDEGVIEIHIAEGAEMARRMQHALDLVAGRWRDNPDIESFVAKRAVISSNRSHFWISIDGELKRMRTPLTIESVPGGLSVLMPEPPELLADQGAEIA